MTQEFIDRLFAAMMNIDNMEYQHPFAKYFWSPSLDGEATKEVRDWFERELPGWFDEFATPIFYEWIPIEAIKRSLSISNLAQFIIDNCKAMFYEECECCFDARSTKAVKFIVLPDKHCSICNGAGKIVKSQFAEAVEMLKGWKDD